MSRGFPARVTGLTVIAVAALGLTACSSSSSSSSSSSPSRSSSTSRPLPARQVVELIVGTKSDDFYVTMECGAQAEATKLGVKLTVNGPADFSVSEQTPILNAVAAAKPDALIVAPTDTKRSTPSCRGSRPRASRSSSWTPTPAHLARLSRSAATTGGGKLAADNLAARSATRAPSPSSTSTPASAPPTRASRASTPRSRPSTRTSRCSPSSTTTQRGHRRQPDRQRHHRAPHLNGVFATNVLSAQGAATGVQHAQSGQVATSTPNRSRSVLKPTPSSSPSPRPYQANLHSPTHARQ